MRYELTKDLETGNNLIDTEHRELFRMINNLQSACSEGKGRDQLEASVRFLMDYVRKHFRDESELQKSSGYPDYAAHSRFHQSYTQQIDTAGKALLARDADIASIAELNRLLAILVTHIRTEDKKVAEHIRASQR